MARTLKSDKTLFWAALALVCTSVVMVVSALAKDNNLQGALLKQVSFAAVGLIGLFTAMRTDYHVLRRPTVIWSLVGIAVLGLLAVFFFAAKNGAQRWITIQTFTVQPSELAKLVAIIFAAAVLERRMHRINDVTYSLLPIGVVTGVLALLIVLEPDLGTAAVLVLVVVVMAIAAGLRWRYVAGVLVLMLPVLTYFVATHGWRVARMAAFLDQGKDLGGKNYQLHQAQIAIGSGGTLGLGLYKGIQKLFFLPEPQNDFILAVIGEELGLLGTTAILICFGVVAWRGLRAALLAPDRFGTLVGIGVAMMIAMQAFINISVVTGMAPTKGIPLPLVSAGGSSLLINMIAMGILLNISQQASTTAATTVNVR